MNSINITAMDLNLLKVFEALYEEGGASRAAVRLGLTQSAVSAALGRLRGLYDDPLFLRRGWGPAPGRTNSSRSSPRPWTAAGKASPWRWIRASM
jgi:hypothetical protein